MPQRLTQQESEVLDKPDAPDAIVPIAPVASDLQPTIRERAIKDLVAWLVE